MSVHESQADGTRLTALFIGNNFIYVMALGVDYSLNTVSNSAKNSWVFDGALRIRKP